MIAAFSGCNGLADDLFCADEGCEWNAREWARVAALSPLPDPPPDPSNKYANDPAAVSFGHRLYFETRFSGRASLQDMLGRPVQQARAAKGQLIGISCATCHDPARGGADHTSVPNNISVGAGWYDVNGQQTVNAAHYPLLYWNGRSDSLWGQAAAVMESPVSMNGDRIAITRTILQHYAADYEKVFGEGSLAAVRVLPSSDEAVKAITDLLRDPASETGPCLTRPPECQPGCTLKGPSPQELDCYPTALPLHGRPGRRSEGNPTTCTFAGWHPTPAGAPRPPKEPFDDAFDCIDSKLQEAITGVFINVTKAIAAYERQLTSRRSPFDQFVAEGPGSQAISAEAKRGLKLFVGKASCVDCHGGPLLSDTGFHNIGVPQTGPGVPTAIECRIPYICNCTGADAATCLPWGFEDGLAKLNSKVNPYRRDGIHSDSKEAAAATHSRFYTMAADPARRGAWRTPSLRDVALTGPYMHSGVFRTLEEVVWHYDQGGEIGEGGPKAPEIKPLFLTARERADLVAFLRTLTGQPDRPELHRALDAMPLPPEEPPPAPAGAP